MSNVTLALVVILFLYCGSAGAAAIEYSSDGYGNYVVSLSGPIIPGDHDKFSQVVSKAFQEGTIEFNENIRKGREANPEKVHAWMSKYRQPKGAIKIALELNSEGGDVEEAMKIGRDVNAYLLNTRIAFGNKCLSACFFIWLAGLEKEAPSKPLEPDFIGIHRLYFSPTQYKDLPPEKAKYLYRELKLLSEKYLDDMGVSEFYIEKMFSVPSNEIYYLTRSQVVEIQKMIPYFHEMLLARCDFPTKIEQNDFDQCYYEMKYIRSQWMPEKCSNMSDDYLAFLDRKVSEMQRCVIAESSIERWNALAKMKAQ